MSERKRKEDVRRLLTSTRLLERLNANEEDESLAYFLNANLERMSIVVQETLELMADNNDDENVTANDETTRAEAVRKENQNFKLRAEWRMLPKINQHGSRVNALKRIRSLILKFKAVSSSSSSSSSSSCSSSSSSSSEEPNDASRLSKDLLMDDDELFCDNRDKTRAKERLFRDQKEYSHKKQRKSDQKKNVKKFKNFIFRNL